MNKIRTNLILYGDYLNAFNKVAFKSGYLIPTALQFDDLKKDIDFIAESVAMGFEGIKTSEKDVLQMLLIFEKVNIAAPNYQFDYSKLEETSLVSVIEDDAFVGSLDWGNVAQTRLHEIKDIIINTIKDLPPFKELYHAIGLKGRTITIKSFIEILYDYYFLKSSFNFNDLERRVILDKFFDHQKKVAIKKQEELTKFQKKERSMHFYEYPEYYWEDLYAIFLSQYVGTLLKLLEYSGDKNSIVMQREFDFHNTLDSNLNITNAQNTLESYKIIRLSYEKNIDNLPKLRNVEDVLKVKDRKEKQIKRLREVINEVEINLRQGRVHALKKAEIEIQNAVKDLNWSEKLDKVDRWLTYLSLPIGIIETSLGIPPIVGMITGVSGVSTTYKVQDLKEKSEWLQVIR